MISSDSVIVATRDHVSSRLGEEVVILGLEDGVYYGLNPVGARVWELIQTPRSIAEIRDCLLREYEVSPEQCAQELEALSCALKRHGLIEIRHGRPVEEAPGRADEA